MNNNAYFIVPSVRISLELDFIFVKNFIDLSLNWFFLRTRFYTMEEAPKKEEEIFSNITKRDNGIFRPNLHLTFQNCRNLRIVDFDDFVLLFWRQKKNWSIFFCCFKWQPEFSFLSMIFRPSNSVMWRHRKARNAWVPSVYFTIHLPIIGANIQFRS